MIKKLFSLALTLLIVLSISVVAFATELAPKVTFSAKTEKFTFANTLGDTTPDLFVGFKNVIPGDSITQKIDVEIKDLAKTDTVKIYLKSETTDKVYLELLKSISVTVKNGADDITAKLADQVLLGTFKADDKVGLTVQLDIPVTVGNEIKSLEGSTDWIFIAEILEDTNAPQTGDHSNNWVFVLVLVIALILIAVLVFLKFKKSNKK